MVCHPVDLKSSLTHLEFRKCDIHKRSDMILWSENDDMIVKLTKLLVDEWWCRIDRKIWIFITLLEIEEFFGQSLDAVVKCGFIFVLVLDDTQLAIGRIIVTLSECFFFLHKSVSIEFASVTDTVMLSIITLYEYRRRIRMMDNIVKLYKGILPDAIIRQSE